MPDTVLDVFHCVAGPRLGEALLCARLQAEKAPTVCQPEVAKTLLCIDLLWTSSYDGEGVSYVPDFMLRVYLLCARS